VASAFMITIIIFSFHLCRRFGERCIDVYDPVFFEFVECF
jgi:hypothetical protein